MKVAAVAAVMLAASVFAQQPNGPEPRDLRGTNYTPGMQALFNNVVGMLPSPAEPGATAVGQFDAAMVDEELKRMRLSGVNNVRLLPSFWAWVIDRNGYMQCLKTLSRLCSQHGITITYQVWSSIPKTSAVMSVSGVVSKELWTELSGSDPSAPTNYGVLNGCLLRSIQHHQDFVIQGGYIPAGEPWQSSIFDEPGNELIALSGDYGAWPYNMKTRINAYLEQIAIFFATDPDGAAAFHGYDLFNEPDAIETIPITNYLQFIKTTYDKLSLHHSDARFTIGWANDDWRADTYDEMAESMGIGRTYYSFHSYTHPIPFAERLKDRKAHAEAAGVDLVCSEFHRTDYTAGTLKYQLAALDREDTGGQIWGFLQSNLFLKWPSGSHPIDGLYIPSLLPGDVPHFEPNNETDLAAFEAWTNGDLSAPPYTTIEILSSDSGPLTSVVPGGSYNVALSSSKTDCPAQLHASLRPIAPPACLATVGPGCMVFPGLGPVSASTNLWSVPLGILTSTYKLFPNALNIPVSATPGEVVTVYAYAGTYPWHDFNLNTGEITAPLALTVQ